MAWVYMGGITPGGYGGSTVNGSSVSTETVIKTITKFGHGFTFVDKPLPLFFDIIDGWTIAHATTNKTVDGLLIEVVDVDTFNVLFEGFHTLIGHTLSIGHYYWLGDNGLQLTQHALIKQSVLKVIDSDTILVNINQPLN